MIKFLPDYRYFSVGVAWGFRPNLKETFRHEDNELLTIKPRDLQDHGLSIDSFIGLIEKKNWNLKLEDKLGYFTSSLF
jgi:hypothetical protein